MSVTRSPIRSAIRRAVRSVIGPLVLLDHFNDTNGTLITAHTPDIGSAATAFAGTEPQIQSGAMTAMAAGVNRSIWDSGITSKEVIIYSAVDIDGVNLAVRYVDTLNFYWAQRVPSGLFRIVEVVAGVSTVRATTSVAYVAGESIKAVDDGSTITFTLTSNGIDTVLSYATVIFNTETKIAVQLVSATTSADYISVRAL